MNSVAKVDEIFQEWKSQGATKELLVVRTAEAEYGWPYGWGAFASTCTPDHRRYYSQRSQCPPQDSENLIKRCQVLNGSAGSCDGCQFYPEDVTGLNDCQGFVRQLLQRVGITLAGGGCTSMWDNNSNWTEKGQKSQMPDKVCLVFQRDPDNPKKMQHVGLHIGNGVIIECATTVRYNSISKPAWTHYAIVKGLEGDTPMPTHTTIRRGSTGPEVVECQEDLIQLNYDLSPYGADGKFGAKTEKAVKDFQKASGLKADGIVGPATWAALDAAVGPGTVLYTVTIPHLTLSQANTLISQYPGAEKTEERSD